MTRKRPFVQQFRERYKRDRRNGRIEGLGSVSAGGNVRLSIVANVVDGPTGPAVARVGDAYHFQADEKRLLQALLCKTDGIEQIDTFGAGI